MGASNIEFRIKGKATRKQIDQRFKEQREEDRDRNGHRDGYSGDFQTVRSVDYKYLSEPFENYDQATDHCLEFAEKWTTVVAVYFKNSKGEVDTLVAGWGAE